jgi:hypothetical protein
VSAALVGALSIAHKVWQQPVWDALAKSKDSDDSKPDDQ